MESSWDTTCTEGVHPEFNLYYRHSSEGFGNLLFYSVFTRVCIHIKRRGKGCPTTYQTRKFFNDSKTNEDIATRFEQEYVRCVRNSYTMR